MPKGKTTKMCISSTLARVRPAAYLTGLCCAISVMFAGHLDAAPKPKESFLTGDSVLIGKQVKLDVPQAFSSRYRLVVESLVSLLERSPYDVGEGWIHAGIYEKNAVREMPTGIADAVSHREGYQIHISENSISIIGADELGLIHGITMLEYMLRAYKYRLPQGRILDWPDHKTRAIHFVLRSLQPNEVKALITKARHGHFNYVILALSDAVQFRSLGRIRTSGSWSLDTLAEIAEFARQNGMEVVPELKLLTHQGHFVKSSYPELLFNKVTLDPSNEQSVHLVYAVLRELVSAIHPKAVHIGHDEVAGYNEKTRKAWLAAHDLALPPDLYLESVIKINRYLHDQGIETWIWGDMLIAPDEFPGMLAQHLHGANGYSKVRGRIPAEVVICDWHYFDRQTEFPSADEFVALGHRVLGATWKMASTTKKFSQYMANLSKGSEGMIATTWYHVQRRESSIVQKILDDSSEAFWNAKTRRHYY